MEVEMCELEVAVKVLRIGKKAVKRNILKQVMLGDVLYFDHELSKWMNKGGIIGWCFADWELVGINNRNRANNSPILILWVNEKGELRKQIFNEYGIYEAGECSYKSPPVEHMTQFFVLS